MEKLSGWLELAQLRSGPSLKLRRTVGLQCLLLRQMLVKPLRSPVGSQEEHWTWGRLRSRSAKLRTRVRGEDVVNKDESVN